MNTRRCPIKLRHLRYFVAVASGVSAADTVPLAVSRLLKRMPRAQVRLIESTMNLLMPQLVRGELDIVVGRSDRQHDDPQV